MVKWVGRRHKSLIVLEDMERLMTTAIANAKKYPVELSIPSA